jgi:hypothetical protein
VFSVPKKLEQMLDGVRSAMFKMHLGEVEVALQSFCILRRKAVCKFSTPVFTVELALTVIQG